MSSNWQIEATPEQSATWVQEAKRLRETGLSYRKIAAQVGRSATVVRKHLVPRAYMYQALIKSGVRSRKTGKMPCTADIEEVVAAHTGMCNLCDRDVELCLDHDHKTGKFRGWLCHKCNVGLAHFFDNPDLLRAAADYLER